MDAQCQLRRKTPILQIPGRRRKLTLVSRYDDIREVLHNHRTYNVPYQERLHVIMGGAKIFLGLDIEPAHEQAKHRMKQIARHDDVDGLAAAAFQEAEKVFQGA